MASPKRLKDSLRLAVDFLEKNNLGYAVIGGIALAEWGVVRSTHDVDIKVLVPDANYPSVQATILAAFPERARLQGPQNPLIVPVTIANVIVDFLLALPGYEELIIQRAVEWNVNGWSAWVCSAEDLIIQKARHSFPGFDFDFEKFLSNF